MLLLLVLALAVVVASKLLLIVASVVAVDLLVKVKEVDADAVVVPFQLPKRFFENLVDKPISRQLQKPFPMDALNKLCY